MKTILMVKQAREFNTRFLKQGFEILLIAFTRIELEKVLQVMQNRIGIKLKKNFTGNKGERLTKVPHNKEPYSVKIIENDLNKMKQTMSDLLLRHSRAMLHFAAYIKYGHKIKIDEDYKYLPKMSERFLAFFR